jgi:hypothetical protein
VKTASSWLLDVVLLAWLAPVASVVVSDLLAGHTVDWTNALFGTVAFFGPLNVFTYCVLLVVMRDWKRVVPSPAGRVAQRAAKAAIILLVPFALMGARGLAWFLVAGVVAGVGLYVLVRPLYVLRSDMV